MAITVTNDFFRGYKTNRVHYIEGACDSLDTKPATGIMNGSTLLELDTGDRYYYSEADTDWIVPGSS